MTAVEPTLMIPQKQAVEESGTKSINSLGDLISQLDNKEP